MYVGNVEFYDPDGGRDNALLFYFRYVESIVMHNILVKSKNLYDDITVRFGYFGYNDGSQHISMTNIVIADVVAYRLFTFGGTEYDVIGLSDFILENVSGGFFFFFL